MVMIDTILGYLKRTKDEPLSVEPFNEIDSLILAQFSYLKFDGMVPELGEEGYATLRSIADHLEYENLYADERYQKNNRALFEGMLNSTRFNNLRVHSYVSILEPERETQFAAMVIEFEDGTTYVAYRGTDENLVGWKEDLNMALQRPIPGQILSVKYLSDVAAILPENFKVGGHSKGGNLAVYAAMYVDDGIQKRISDIYNHDGPGFRNEVMDDKLYLNIRDRIRMTVPHSSLIGMLLVNLDTYRVVESWKPGFTGILQHDPFSWLVKGYDFLLADGGVRDASELKDRSINEWVMSLDEEERERFIDAVYDIMLSTGVEDLNELIAEWKDVLPRVAMAMKDMDDDTKNAMSRILQLLVTIIEANMKQEANEKIDEFRLMAEEAKEAVGRFSSKVENSFLETTQKIKKEFEKKC